MGQGGIQPEVRWMMIVSQFDGFAMSASKACH